MKSKLFIVGDVHGEYDLLKKLLTLWNKEEEQLVFLGDLADRGPKSKQCFLLVKQLVENEQAICLSGNHEDILLKWLAEPQDNFDWYLRNGGQATLESLLYPGVMEEESPLDMAKLIQGRFAELIEFIEELPLYYETEYCICVHAGVNLALENWKDTSRRDFIWIRDPFHQAKNTLDKYIVFGHTPVQSLHSKLTDTHLWYSDKKIGIDGGAVYHGALHGVVLSENGIEADYQVMHPQHRWE
ncbi:MULTISPECIES: metallophosphoesterase family protein [unclassified Granulicatella]|uniref:metallophosphoesterase family protein n=1 Tax=unclassified Granulicatella TaxID=2630493 RepID=UPI0010740758|nr:MULTISPECIES: metallophosphoesterase family protein [unclassified Granulicatella]MBF0779501.1 serine/threonine protein phosphatase [Granulicatella sp. 19428wC4_WM01]TFU96467.1 serine/threonine protein phosphatase [Granulicatella sp. WM01]